MKTLLILFVLAFALCAQTPAPAPAPGITKQALADRLTALQKQREQTIADLQAINGAMQDTQYWLDFLEAQEKAAKKPEAKPEEVKKP